MITTWYLHILGDLVDGLLDRGAQIAPANLKADGQIAGTVFSENVVSVVANLGFGQLSQRDALSRGREQSNILDSLLGIAIRFLIAHHHVVDCLSLQDLADRITADGGLDGILYIGHIDAVARSRQTVNGEIDIRLARIALKPQIRDPVNFAHNIFDLFALFLENVQVRPVKLGSQSAFRAGKRFIHVVLNGL